jgi:hypothetical protein
MLRRIWAAVLISACGCGLATRGIAADLTRLSPDQQQAARCILDVVSHERGVTNSNVEITEDNADTAGTNSTVRIVLEYTYHPRSRYLPREHVQRLDITDLVTTKHESVVFGGVITAPHTSLNEIDDDLFAISRKLQTKCGLELAGVTE